MVRARRSSCSRCRVSTDEARNPVRHPAARRVGGNRGWHGSANLGSRARPAVLPVDRRRLGRYRARSSPASTRARNSTALQRHDAGQEAGHDARRRLPRRRVHPEDDGDASSTTRKGLQGHLHGRRRGLRPRHRLRQRRRRPQGRASRSTATQLQRRHAGPAARRQHDERHRIGPRRQGHGAGHRHEPEARRRRPVGAIAPQ